MNTKETALIGFVAAVFSIICCQILIRAAGHHAQLSSAQVSAGLTICLAGVAVGLLLVICASAFQRAGSRWDRSVGALGLVLGCAVLFVLVGRHSPHPAPAAQTAREPINPSYVAAARNAPLLAPGPSR